MTITREPGFFIYEPNLPFTAYLYSENGAPDHWHPYWEMLCQVEGETSIHIGNDTFLSKAGDINIIGPEETHSTSCLTTRHKLLVVQFETSTIVPYLFSFLEFKYLSASLIKEIGYKRHFSITFDNNHVQEVMNRILDEFNERGLGFELEVQSLLMHLFSFFVRNRYINFDNIPKVKIDALTQIRPILTYIENNYHEKITLQYIADMACMSPYAFCRIFKKATSKTLTEYINNVRLNEAERLILSTNDKITAISMDIGFSNVNYFNRLFKLKYQIPPQEYRKQYSARLEQEKSGNRSLNHYKIEAVAVRDH
jgi:AraC-like DNA-binding protein